MFSLLSKTLLTLTIVITSLVKVEVLSQDVPTIACPDIFQYLTYGYNYIGKITLYGASVSTIKVEAQFSQREPITTGFSGRISLIDTLPDTQANLQSGKPISYRVDFPNPFLLPKLTQIKVNEQTICSDYGLPPPSTVFTIHHIFYPSSTTLRRTSQPNLNINSFDEDFIKVFGKELGNTGTYHVQEITLPIRKGYENRPHMQPTVQPNTFIPQPPPRVLPITPPTAPPPPQPPLPPLPPRYSSPNLASTCGQEGSSLTPFIVGGHDFERGRFPWLTAIYVRQSADLKFICGGSLISARTVVTAAHCFQGAQITADRIVVYLGRHNLYSSEYGVEQRDVQTLIKHPEYNTSAISDADIALLQMRTPVSFTQYIRPICLWSSVVAVSNQVAFVAGWGADNNGIDVTPVPKMAEVNIVSEAECLRSSDIFRTLTSSRSLCAGNRDGSGPCIGDSGGGLMVNNAGKWMLRAVTSLGITNNVNNRRICNLNEYVVFCDISKHIRWVQQNTLS